MAIDYKDFYPTVLEDGFFSTTHEGLSETVARANKWLEQFEIAVITIETVVLPNIRDEEGASQVGIYTAGKSGSRWYQVVRVWYEQKTPGVPPSLT